MALRASSPRRIASSLSKRVMPTPLPLLRSTSISIFAPSSPAGVSPDSTSARTMPIASSTVAGSLSKVATRAYMSPPGRIDSDRDQTTPVRAGARDTPRLSKSHGNQQLRPSGRLSAGAQLEQQRLVPLDLQPPVFEVELAPKRVHDLVGDFARVAQRQQL